MSDTPRTDAYYFPFGRNSTVVRGSSFLEDMTFAATLERELATAHALLREWLATELDALDEEFVPWLDQFTEKVRAALGEE